MNRVAALPSARAVLRSRPSECVRDSTICGGLPSCQSRFVFRGRGSPSSRSVCRCAPAPTPSRHPCGPSSRHSSGMPVKGAVRATAVANLYEVRLGDQFIYVTGDAKFFLHGDLYETRGQRNLTESSRKEVRRDIVGRHRSADVHRLRAVGAEAHGDGVHRRGLPILREVSPRGAGSQRTGGCGFATRPGRAARKAPRASLEASRCGARRTRTGR